MQRQAKVTAITPQTGLMGLRPDGQDSFVLAQQIDARPLSTGQTLAGEMDCVGMETLVDARTQDVFQVFVEAYGLSAEAVEQAIR